MPLTTNIARQTGGYVQIKPVGSIDSETASDFEATLCEALSQKPKNMLLDMEGVEYISSMGLSVLVKLQKKLKEKQGTLIVVNLQPQIKKVIKVIESLPAMNIFASIEEADNYLMKIQRDEIDKRKQEKS